MLLYFLHKVVAKAIHSFHISMKVVNFILIINIFLFLDHHCPAYYM